MVDYLQKFDCGRLFTVFVLVDYLRRPCVFHGYKALGREKDTCGREFGFVFKMGFVLEKEENRYSPSYCLCFIYPS